MKNKKIFWVDWGTFYGNTMVCCGWKNYEDLKKHLEKKKYYDWLRALDDKDDISDFNHFSSWKYKNIKYSMLWLKDWKNDIEHYKILSHELVHAVQQCMPDFLDISVEQEAVAYQHSYLFMEIINGLK